MKRILTALLAAIGVHKTLSAAQKNDLVAAGIQSTPSAVFGGASQAAPPAEISSWGSISANELVLLASVFFILLQCAYLVWKWRRDARLDREHQQDRERRKLAAKARGVVEP